MDIHMFYFLLLLIIMSVSTAKTTQTTSRTLLPYLQKLNREYNVVLASGSPRRRELLNLIGIKDFKVAVSNFPENLDMKQFPKPQDYCLNTAIKKVEQIVHDLNSVPANTVIIGADTIVVIDDIILEKPKDDNDSARMIRMLSGRSHFVHTAVTIFSNAGESSVKEFASFVETTAVNFDELTEEDIQAYVLTGEGRDKAGSYGIQGVGGQLVRGVDGCYFNVMGLPVNALSKHLAQLVCQSSL